MKRRIILYICILFAQLIYAQERPKVALVLSGGGAKGIAHIGALEVIEKAGIPIDMIVGTSMGSIVGGLYSIGYDSQSLKKMVREQDWSFLLSDKVSLDNLSIIDKSNAERYLVSIPFGKERQSLAGMIDGHNLMRLFADLTIGYHDSLSFDSLPIPFRCVSMNAIDGKEIILKDGSLMVSMRASMAIPAVFSPVVMDSLVLVDGGLVNNFPVDVAKAMGADIVIGVDVQSDLKDLEELNGFSSLMGQLVDVLCLNKYTSNKAMADVYIHPDMRGYTSASFSSMAVDSLLKRGRDSAYEQWGELLKVKEQRSLVDTVIRPQIEMLDSVYIHKIILQGIRNTDEKWLRRYIRVKENSMISLKDIEKSIAILYGTQRFGEVDYRLLNKPNYDLELSFVEQDMNMLNLGFRFDSEDVAAILLNTRVSMPFLRGSRIELSSRLSTNPYFKLRYTIENKKLRSMSVDYTYRKNDFMFYNQGDKYVNVEYVTNSGGIHFSGYNAGNFITEIGARYDYFKYEPFLYSQTSTGFIDVKSNGYLVYDAKIQYETLNKRYFPTKGISFNVRGDVYTDNGYQLNEKTPNCAIQADFLGVISITSRLKCLPFVMGRTITGKGTPFPYLNVLGGYSMFQYVPQQIPFCGISKVEIMPNSILVSGLQLRQRAGARHYMTLIGNVSLYDDDFFNMMSNYPLTLGMGAGYSYSTNAGPIELMFSYSDYTKSLGVYFSIGFYF